MRRRKRRRMKRWRNGDPIIFFWFCGPQQKKDLKIPVSIHFVAYLDRTKLVEHSNKNFKYHFSKKKHLFNTKQRRKKSEKS